LWDYPKRPRVIGCKEIFKEAGDVLWLKSLWYIFVELPKIPSVVGYKDLREGGRHSDC